MTAIAESYFRRFPLSDTQVKTAALILSGHSNKEIAQRVFRSIHTVKNATREIYQQTGVQTRSEFIAKYWPEVAKL